MPTESIASVYFKLYLYNKNENPVNPQMNFDVNFHKLICFIYIYLSKQLRLKKDSWLVILKIIKSEIPFNIEDIAKR